MLVPMQGEPIEDGAVAINGKHITGLGRFADVKATHGGDVLDLGELVVLPGLINGHCHLDYTSQRDQIPPQHTFTDWIRAINARKATLSEEDYVASIEAGLAEVRRFGTTTVLNLEAFPTLLPRISQPAIRVWWCAEMIDIREEVPVHQLVEQLHEWFDSHSEWLGGFGLAPHALFTASPQLFSDSSELARRYHVPVATHLAESNEEMLMFRQATGPLFGFLKSIGRQLDDCGAQTPLSLLLRNQAVDERWIITHLNELGEEDFDLLTRVKKFHVAHCPRSHTFFGHSHFKLRKLQSLGFNVCLGTDSLASNSSLNLFAEMRELIRKEPGISPREVLAMITTNAAEAIGQGDSLGKISPGLFADLIGIPCGQTGDDLFEEIAQFEGTVPWMMVNGVELMH